jgi:hypothetical protein
MILCAAARSLTKPALYTGKGAYHRPMMGYGHSFYRIDLCCDKILRNKYRNIETNSFDHDPNFDRSKNNKEKIKDLRGGIGNEGITFEDM